MSGNKSFATLTPTLLARKGGAKPAMRPQLQPLHEFHEATARDMADDLGWNDMGSDILDDEESQPTGAQVVSIVGDAYAEPLVADIPEVIHRQASLNAQLSAPATPREPALGQGRRAAFTLRLDANRHLKLRLASTALGRSAQEIVTEALDNHLRGLGDIADIEELAAQIRKNR